MHYCITYVDKGGNLKCKEITGMNWDAAEVLLNKYLKYLKTEPNSDLNDKDKMVTIYRFEGNIDFS